MEGGKLKCMYHLDRAGMYGLDEQIERLETRDPHLRYGELEQKRYELALAQVEDIKMIGLFGQSSNLRLTQRALNDFLVAIMEGRIKPGQEAFSNFLIELAGHIATMTEQYVKILGFYIKLSYGDNSRARAIPFELGSKIALFSSETKLLANEAARLTEEKQNDSVKSYKDERWGYFYPDRKTARERREGIKYVVLKS